MFYKRKFKQNFDLSACVFPLVGMSYVFHKINKIFVSIYVGSLLLFPAT